LALHVGDDPDAVRENRRRAAGAVGLGLDDLVFCQQSHGRGVAGVGAGDGGRGALRADDASPAADALGTAAPGVGLGVVVADCVPLVLHDPVAGVLACVHAGWRGTVARVVTAAVDTMGSLGARPARTRVGIGPAIASARYEVGDDVADAARETFGAAADRVL